MITEGEKLTVYRKRNGLTQEALAEQLGVTQSCISNWERYSDIPKNILTNIRQLTKPEMCLLIRHRIGWGLHELANEYGISHTHLIKIEDGKATATQTEEYYQWLNKNFRLKLRSPTKKRNR